MWFFEKTDQDKQREKNDNRFLMVSHGSQFSVLFLHFGLHAIAIFFRAGFLFGEKPIHQQTVSSQVRNRHW